MAQRRSDALQSAILIIGVPLVFWMLVLEGVAAVAGLEYGNATRLAIGGLLGGLLALIWGCVRQAR